MKFCRICGTELTEEEDLDYEGKCVNCIGENITVDSSPIDSSPNDPPCYICRRPFFINCENCGKPLCSVHVKESTKGRSPGSSLIAKRCPDCDKRNRIIGNSIQIGLIIVVMMIFLIVLPFFNR